MAEKTKSEATRPLDINGTYKVDVIADLFNVSVRRIQQLTQDGVIDTVTVQRGRRYELGPTIQKYTKYLSDKAYGRAKTETEDSLKEQKLRAEIDLKESQGELHRLRTDIAAGRYLSIEQIKADYSRFFVSFKSFAMSIPSKIAGQLVGTVEPSKVRQLEKGMRDEITKLLESFVVGATVEDFNSDKDH